MKPENKWFEFPLTLLSGWWQERHPSSMQKTSSSCYSTDQHLYIPNMNIEFSQHSFGYCLPELWNKDPATVTAFAVVAKF